MTGKPDLKIVVRNCPVINRLTGKISVEAHLEPASEVEEVKRVRRERNG